MQTDYSTYSVLELSSKAEYALLALLELASHSPQFCPLTTVAINEKHKIPERYLEQVLATLRRGGLVRSHRGARGGFVLAREPREITLLEIFMLVEGERKQRCSEIASTIDRAVVYKIWQEYNLRSQQFLNAITLEDLLQQRDTLKQAEPMYYI